MALYDNPYIPTANPYTPFMYQRSQQITPVTNAPHYEIPKVHGIDGANAFQMGPNSAVFLLDDSSENIVIYMAITDSAGYKTLTRIDGVIHQDTPAEDPTAKLGDQLTSIEEKVNALQDKFSKFEEFMK